MRLSNSFVSLMALCIAALVVAEDIADDIPSDCTIDPMISIDTVMRMHNEARRKEGGLSRGIQPLVWSKKLACSAQKWADGFLLVHSPTPYAESIGANTVEETIQDWYMEWQYYKQGDPATEQTGHYFNMAWKDIGYVGCGARPCTSTQLGLDQLANPGQLIVCQYKDNGHISTDSNTEVWRPIDPTPLWHDSSSDHSNDTAPPPKTAEPKTGMPLPPPQPPKSDKPKDPPPPKKVGPSPQPTKQKPSPLKNMHGDPEYCG